jgi:hypothetical protein
MNRPRPQSILPSSGAPARSAARRSRSRLVPSSISSSWSRARLAKPRSDPGGHRQRSVLHLRAVDRAEERKRTWGVEGHRRSTASTSAARRVRWVMVGRLGRRRSYSRGLRRAPDLAARIAGRGTAVSSRGPVPGTMTGEVRRNSRRDSFGQEVALGPHPVINLDENERGALDLVDCRRREFIPDGMAPGPPSPGA